MKKKKLKTLEVQSFVTQNSNVNDVKGGATAGSCLVTIYVINTECLPITSPDPRSPCEIFRPR